MKLRAKVVQVVLFKMVLCFRSYNFVMHFQEIRIRDIDLIPDKSQGIYSWHLQPKKLNQVKYYKLYERLNNFEIELQGSGVFNNSSKFGDSFKGGLKRDNSASIDEKIKNLNDEFIISFLTNNSIPLYIGRSVDLRGRLKKHYSGYLDAMSRNYLSSFNQKSNFDSEEESGYFGLRLANFNKEKWFLENELKIRIFINNTIPYDQIKGIEFYLNRSYKPILGLI